ncbi:MAG: hypothetical protein ABWY16_15720 [Pedobacter sp.]|jgi:hypothetical protein|uniref:hypothetical protein n=1 Tax=Pedobacter sp. TaxID=1411316 RepID=UPI00339285FE
MYKYLIILPLVFVLVVCLISCSPANNKPVMIRFSPDSSGIVFSRIDAAGLLELRNTSGIDTSYSSVLSVMEMTGENNPLAFEHEFPGRLAMSDSTIVFTPLVTFSKGKSYQVVSYLNAKFGNAAMMLTGKLDNKVKPQTVVLTR